MRTRFALLWLLCAAGCSADGLGPNAPEPVAQVDRVHLLLPLNPTADLDGKPGSDGVMAEVFFERVDRPAGVAVSGTLEVLFYEGVPAPTELAQKEPFHVETFPNATLRRMEGAWMYGISYRIPVAWGPKPPASKSITLVVRYLPPAGPPTLSRPEAILLRSD